MNKIVVLTFIFTLSFFSKLCFAADGTKNYLRIDYGIGSFKTDKLDNYNATPYGNSMGVAFGTRFEYLELGFIYRKMSFEGDIITDSLKNKIQHDGSTYGLEMNIFLNNRFSLKVGYALNTFEQKLETSVSNAALIAVRSTYGIEEDHQSSGVFYGASVDLLANPRYDLYLSVIHFPTSSSGNSGSATVAQFGIRFYVKSVLETFFSHSR